MAAPSFSEREVTSRGLQCVCGVLKGKEPVLTRSRLARIGASDEIHYLVHPMCSAFGPLC
jgi:hypothetical protein